MIRAVSGPSTAPAAGPDGHVSAGVVECGGKQPDMSSKRNGMAVSGEVSA